MCVYAGVCVCVPESALLPTAHLQHVCVCNVCVCVCVSVCVWSCVRVQFCNQERERQSKTDNERGRAGGGIWESV